MNDNKPIPETLWLEEEAKKVFNGNDTANARIKIDYRGEKPNVSFSYPNKKYQVHGSMLPWILIIWMSFTFIIIKLIEFFMGITILKDFMGITTILKDNGNLWYAINLLALLLLPPALIYYPFESFWSNVYPKWNAILHSKKFKRFLPKDVQEKDGRYFCEVLIFKNILLNYKATKDFSRQLEYMEIHEHNFKYYVLKRKKKKGRKPRRGIFFRNSKEREINEWVWYARFYFRNKPRNGKLEVIFV